MNSDFRRWAALVVVCLGQLMIMLDGTIVNVALPSIQLDLGFSEANLTWVVNAYAIAYGSFLLVAGRVGDLIGRRKVFMAGVFLFTVASVGSGFAQESSQLITGRFLQGLGGSMSAGVILAIIITEFQKAAERAKAMSVFTFVIAGGGSLGLLAGGALTQLVSWHWIFFINLPIGIATLILGAWLIKENEGLGLDQGVDIAGSILITAALMVGVYSIVTAADYGWTSEHTMVTSGAALALVAAFVFLESRLSNPIMPLRILRVRSLTGASAARGLLVAGLFTNFFVGVLYLQHVRGFSAIETGLAFLPTTLGTGLMSTGISARLMARLGPRNLLMGGLATMVGALVVLSTLGQSSGYLPWMLVGYAMLGTGAGMSFLPLLTISMSEVATADAGLASGFSNVAMQVGGALGLAALGTIATDRAASLVSQGRPLQAALTSGYDLGFLLAAGSVALGLLVVMTVLRPAGSLRTEPARRHIDPAEVEAA